MTRNRDFGSLKCTGPDLKNAHFLYFVKNVRFSDQALYITITQNLNCESNATPLNINYRLKNQIFALNSQGDNFTVKNFEKKIVLLGVKVRNSIFLSEIIVKFNILNNNYR